MRTSEPVCRNTSMSDGQRQSGGGDRIVYDYTARFSVGLWMVFSRFKMLQSHCGAQGVEKVCYELMSVVGKNEFCRPWEIIKLPRMSSAHCGACIMSMETTLVSLYYLYMMTRTCFWSRLVVGSDTGGRWRQHRRVRVAGISSGSFGVTSISRASLHRFRSF